MIDVLTLYSLSIKPQTECLHYTFEKGLSALAVWQKAEVCAILYAVISKKEEVLALADGIMQRVLGAS